MVEHTLGDAGGTRASWPSDGGHGGQPRSAPLEVWGRGRISDVAWSRDGKHLLVAGAIGIVEHAVANLAVRRKLTEAADIELIVPGEDGLLIIASPQAIIRWSSNESATASVVVHHTQPPLAVVLDPIGLAAVDDGYTVRVYRIPSGESLATLATSSVGLPGSLSFSPDRKRLAVVADRATEVWDIPGKRLLSVLPEELVGVRRVAFQDHDTLVTASSGGIARWRASTGTLIETIADDIGDVLHLAVAPSGAIAAATPADVLLWPQDGPARRISARVGLLRRLAFSPDELTLLTASASELHLWDARDGAARGSLSDYWDGVGDVTFAPDGRHLAALAGNGRVWSFDEPWSDKVVITRWAAGRSAAAFSPDGELLALANAGELRVYRMGSGAEVCRWPARLAQSGGLSFTQDSRRLILVSEAGVQLHDAASGAPVEEPGPGFADAKEIVLSPDGRVFAVVRKGEAQLWRIAPRALCSTFPAPDDCNGAALCADGRLLALADDQSLRVWDTASGALACVIPAGASLVAISLSGHLLAAASGRELCVYGVADGSFYGRFDRHADAITSLTFAPDERCIATGSRDGTVRLWPIAERPA